MTLWQGGVADTKVTGVPVTLAVVPPLDTGPGKSLVAFLGRPCQGCRAEAGAEGQMMGVRGTQDRASVGSRSRLAVTTKCKVSA